MRNKKVLAMLFSIAAICILPIECNAENGTSVLKQAEEKYKVGITLQSLSNSYWKGVFGQVDQILQKKGWDYNIVSCNDNPDEQISQIKSFIRWGCDLIMVHPSDVDAIEEICEQAQESGIKIMCWDDNMIYSDLNWVLDNEEIGVKIGEAAGNFINENYNGVDKIETVIINYPQTDVLQIREDYILKTLEEKASGKYKIVARESALEPGTALVKMDSVLEEYPDCKVICSIGAGGNIGANEAFIKAMNGKIPDDVGIFSADATKEQLQSITDGEATRVVIGMEGSDKKTAETVVDLYEKIIQNETEKGETIYRPLFIIDKSNAEEYLKDY